MDTMDVDIDNKVPQNVLDIIDELHQVRRKLQYIHVPVMITAMNLRIAQELIDKLKQFPDLGVAGTNKAATEIQKTQTVIQAVLEALNISDPNYGRRVTMVTNARQAERYLLDCLNVLLQESSSTKKGRKNLKQDIVGRVQGRSVEVSGTIESNFVEGLLTGKSQRQIMEESQTGETKAQIARLMSKYPFDKLRQLFNPKFDAGGTIKWPRDLVDNSYGQTTEPSRPCTDQYVKDKVGDRSGPNEHLKIINVDKSLKGSDDDHNAEQSSKGQDKSKDFLGLLDCRLRNAKMPDAQRTRIVNYARANLQARRLRPAREAERVLVQGLITGQDSVAMIHSCDNLKDARELADLLERVDLKDLKLGEGWSFAENGQLIIDKEGSPVPTPLVRRH